VPQLRNATPRRLAGLVAAAAALLVLAACGSDADTASTGDAQQGGARSNAFAAYTQCLAKNGVTITMPSGGAWVRPSGAPSGFPSGVPRPSGSARAGGGFPGGGFGKPADVDDATWAKAQAACASVLPSGRPGGNGRGNGMSAAYRNCLQDNGVTLGQGGLATDDPAVKKATEACEALAPATSPSPSPAS
jgi:hypothetical protein